MWRKFKGRYFMFLYVHFEIRNWLQIPTFTTDFDNFVISILDVSVSINSLIWKNTINTIINSYLRFASTLALYNKWLILLQATLKGIILMLGTATGTRDLLVRMNIYEALNRHRVACRLTLSPVTVANIEIIP